ncbi:ankyrin repeat domain-containing protein 10 [Plakobranchus ocellatus]|uniref:Ankyrin repeat domain-containing protein 10 n=1 Tax=Plakobranchus ocellatus TaxID=259542 RepID=A0AAV3Y1M4_9GAST|nr:ankyrin repeat domain-containing protein 10 [Plakobranchus ocellatus]
MAMKFEGQGPPMLDNASQAILAQTQFHFACYTGDGHMLDTLIGRTLLQNNNDGTAMEACVGALLSEEDSVNGWTPAHWAAFYGQLSCLMKLHVRPHLGFDTPSLRSNVSPLHLAAKSGAVLCLKWLLQLGASKNRQDFMGETPLHKAAKSGNSDCAAMLVGHGASLSVKNYRGLTAADVAEQSTHSALAQYLRRASEQAEYGGVTECDDSALPISDLSGALSPKTCEKPQFCNSNLPSVTPGGDAPQSLIFMNGERIYASNCEVEGFSMDTDDHDMEQEVSHSEFGYSDCKSDLGFLGKKRSFEECEEFEHLYKRKCTGLSSDSQVNSPRDAVAQSSVMEHCASLVAEQGYDSTFMTTMSSVFH